MKPHPGEVWQLVPDENHVEQNVFALVKNVSRDRVDYFFLNDDGPGVVLNSMTLDSFILIYRKIDHFFS